MVEYMLQIKGSERAINKVYKDITAARRAGYKKAWETDKRIIVFKGYKKLTYEGEILPPERSTDAWGGRVFYMYFSDAKHKWITRRLTHDGKLHEEWKNVKW